MTAEATESPLKYPDFRAFFVAKLGSTLAQLIMVIVIGWQVYDIARITMPIREAAFLLGLIGLAQFIPVFFLTLIVGVIADRIDRRYIAAAAIALELLCAVGLAIFTLAGWKLLWPLFVVAMLLGVGRAFASPSLTALAPNLVPPAILPTAIALNSIAWQIGAVAGPVVGGVAYDFWAPLAYIISASLFLVALLAMLFIKPVAIPPVSKGSALQQVGAGIRYVRSNQVVAGAITLDLCAVILAGANAMLPIFARDILMVGPAGLGMLRGAPAAGAGIVALILVLKPLSRKVGKRMLISVGIFAAATVVFGLSTSLPLSLAALAVLGAADMISVYVRQSLIQLHTPDSMRGRVSAVSTLFISASNELGEMRAGMTAAFFGAVEATVIGGVLALGVTSLWGYLFPKLRDADRFVVPDELLQEEKQNAC